MCPRAPPGDRLVARPLRIEFDGAWHHVMNRGAGRRHIFRGEGDHNLFLGLLADASSLYGIEIHAYCLMSNHYHLLIRTPRSGLARGMRHLDGVFTQRFNRRAGTDGPLFRGRYRSVLVGEDSHLCVVSRYIHLNPSTAGIVSRPEQYRPSSYRAYLGLSPTPPWLHTQETLRRFETGGARDEYRRFIDEGIDDDTRTFFDLRRRPPIFGSKQFRKQIEERARQDGLDSDPERPGYQMLTEPPALDVIALAVCHAFDVSVSELRPAARRRPGVDEARGALVLLGREVGRQNLKAIAKWIGYRSYAGASKAMCRLRARIATQENLGARINKIRRELTQSDPCESRDRVKT